MKLLARSGDADPLTYGGLLVIEDDLDGDDGGCHIEVWDAPSSDGKVTIHRVNIEKFTYSDNILSDNPYHPDKRAWFAGNLESIARTNDCQVGRLLRLFLSDNPVERTEGYRMVASYYGWHQFDPDPLVMSVGKAAWRYRDFDLGEVPREYGLLDQVRKYCLGHLDRIEKATPTGEVYWLAHRSGQTFAYDDVVGELDRIEKGLD